MKRIAGLPLVGFTLFLLAGCSGKTYVPVSGTVTLNGTPIAGATVSFHPANKSEDLRQANGLTDKSGKYSLSTVNHIGALPGKYKVTVVKSQMVDENTKVDPNNVRLNMQTPQKKIDLVPRKYMILAETDLVMDVAGPEMNGADLKLTGQPEPPPVLEDSSSESTDQQEGEADDQPGPQAE